MKKSIVGEEGLNATWEELPGSNVVKVTTKDGRTFYLEVEQSNRTPGETAEAILGSRGWPQAKKGFYEAVEKDGIELPAELKGSKEVNLLIQEALLEGWRPDKDCNTKKPGRPKPTGFQYFTFAFIA